MKKVVIFTVFLMMFQLVSGMIPVFAEGDSTPPLIKSVSIGPKKAEVGDTITFSADIEDDMSGVKYVFSNFSSPSGGRSLSPNFSYNNENGKYEATHKVTEEDEGGTWKFKYIASYDQVENNKTYYQNDFENNLDFEIINENGDSTPPLIKSVSISPKKAEVGDTITFSADIEDDMSGVKYVFSNFSSPSGGRSLSPNFSYNNENGKYEATHKVTEEDEGGTWKFKYIASYDQVENNKTYYQNDFENNLNFEIINENGDFTPPLIKSVSINPREAKVGDIITFSADIEDDKSGVKYVFSNFSSPSGGRSLSPNFSYNNENGKYEATHEVTEEDEEGVWKFKYIASYDQVENNKTYYQNAFENNLNFVIRAVQPDLENPSINDPELPYVVTTKDEAWINKTIDKDLYIGPNSTITIADDVTITGDVYVYGTLITHGGLSIGGTLNAKTVTYGSTSYAAPGAVRVVGGVNSIRSTSVSNQAYPVPFDIHSENLTNDMDTAVIKGKTLPFLDLTMQGNLVSLEVDGSFTATADPVTSDGISFNLRDVFGNNTKKQISVTDVVAPAEVQNFSVSKTTESELQVSWDANSEQDLNGYELYLNGEYVEAVSADMLDYTFIGLEEGTKYNVSIAAVDFSDNVGEFVKTSGTTLLSKPVVEPISDKATSVTGHATAGTTILIAVGEDELATGKVSSNGKFAIEIPAQQAGTELSISASNEAGVVSEKTIITVEDKTAPAAPKVNTVSDKDTLINGTAEAGAAIAIKLGDSIIGEGSADESGNFSIAIPKQQAGDKLTVIATDAAGNASEALIISVIDKTAPKAPTVEEITDKTVLVKGTTEAGSSISVKQGSAEIGTATADVQGNYVVSIAKQTAGTELNVTATDKAGNISEATIVTVLDVTAPKTPEIESVSDKDTVLTGLAEALSTITIKNKEQTIAEGVVKESGDFQISIPLQKADSKLTIVSTDKAGNSSKIAEVTVIDKTAPEAPIVEEVTDQSTFVEGTAEANSTISIKIGEELADAITDSNGNFNVPISKQTAGTVLKVTAVDKAGNVSKVTEVTILDATAPEMPTVEEVTDKSTVIKGSAEAESLVMLDIDGKEIGNLTADTNGHFELSIDKLKAGTKLNIRAKDAAGNISEPNEVTVLDVTVPEVPAVDEVNDQSTSVTGTGEIGSSIVIKLNNKTIGEGIVSKEGTFNIEIPVQRAGTELFVLSVDKAGNISDAKKIKVIDETAPQAPIVDEVTDQSKVVSGKAEASTLVTLKAGNDILGTATAGSEGSFNIDIPAQKAGTKLTLTAKDSAGHISEEIEIIVLDITSPTAPSVEEVTDKSTTVTGSAEAGSNVLVRTGSRELAKTIADKEGNYEVSIAKQKAGTKLTVTATDAAGNTSEAVEVTVSDVTSPEVPSVNPVTHKATEITGHAEALGKVSVMKGSEVIASGTATEDGTYRIAIDPQPVDTKLEVTVADQAGNISGKASVLVKKAAPEETTRISGASRYGTAIAISKEGWETADTVVLATAADFPDALAGGPLAFQEDAPILLTRTGNLTPETKEEIERLGAEKVIILGSKGAVSLEVEEEVKQMGITTERIGGKNRFDTAALIAERLDSKEAVVAYGLNFPDVLSVSAYAAKNGIPILLTRTDKLPAETAVALESTTKTHVIGSTGAVGEAVFNSLPNPVRYGGKNRYETGLEVNNKLMMGTEKAFIATGSNFPDALAGSVLAAKNDAPILLVKEQAIPDATAQQLDAYEAYSIFGGTGAVGETVREQLDQQLMN